jgi:uncharacterized membrane protein YfcA
MKEIFVNLSNDIILSILVFIISIITTIGGVGGGGLLIPTYIFIGKFSLEEAIPLSVMTILGDTLVRIVNLYLKKHPMNSKRYLINMMPILLIVPFDGNFSFLGVILSEIMPNIVTLGVIILTLGLTFYKSIVKAVRTFLKENEYLDSNNLELVIIDGIGEYFDINKLEEYKLNNGIGDTLSDKIKKTLIIFFTILVISTFCVLRMLNDKCSINNIVNIISQFIVVGIISYYIINYIKKDYERKRLNNYIFLEGDIIWNNANITKFIIIASLTGILSTYMGIGGGMLITPIMIQVGMIPEVVIATGSITTFFSSLISTLNYLLAGRLNLNYGILLSIMSMLGSLVGLKLSDLILSRLKRQSILIFIVSLILLISGVMLVNSVIMNGLGNLEIGNYCKF